MCDVVGAETWLSHPAVKNIRMRAERRAGELLRGDHSPSFGGFSSSERNVSGVEPPSGAN